MLFSLISQSFPPRPQFTEKDIPDLSGKICIVTGASSGVGREVAQVLYGRNATVYIATRNEEKSREAIAAIKQQHPSSTGCLKFIYLDLADLSSVAASATGFLAAETSLHLLFNNAGVMTPPEGSKTKQGYELQLGTNCLGHFLFTKILTPLLKATAMTAPPDSVRVVWVSSSAVDALSPPGGFEPDNLDYHQPRSAMFKYGVSKAGNYYHNTEFARRFKQDGILSASLNPGNLHSELDRTSPWYFYYLRLYIACYPPINGAYTELFAAFSPQISADNSGAWVVPWGRFLPIRADLQRGAIPESEGGTGMAQRFWEWSNRQVQPYLAEDGDSRGR